MATDRTSALEALRSLKTSIRNTPDFECKRDKVIDYLLQYPEEIAYDFGGVMILVDSDHNGWDAQLYEGDENDPN